jgi:hypothetical protein
MRATIDGRLVELAPGSSVADLKHAAGIPAGDAVVTIGGNGSRILGDDDAIVGGRYRSLPPTTQG